MSNTTASVQCPSIDSAPAPIAHEDWARSCFEHILAEKRHGLPLMCSLDDLLPLDYIPADLVEPAVRATLDEGRSFKFIAYGIRRQTRMIPLRGTTRGSNYFKVDDPSIWHDTSELRGRWSFMRPFIDALPFASVGRAQVIFSNGAGRGILHFDHDKPTIQHEFIWLKLTSTKRFFIRYGSTDHYVTSRSCWFDSRHIHQADQGPGLEISMRVDGVFAPEFRQRVVERCAKVLGLEAVPYVMPPEPSYVHPDRSDWNRLFKPRHYGHYFGLLAVEFARTLRWRRKEIATELGRTVGK